MNRDDRRRSDSLDIIEAGGITVAVCILIGVLLWAAGLIASNL